jgi:uncharacterized repeat protein (TIGR01451 family)
MPSNRNHTSGVDVYAGSSYMAPWIGWDLAGAWYRSFVSGFDGYKTASTYTALPGETFTYTIALQNHSAVDDYAYIVDTLPDEVTFVSVEAPATYNAGVIKWIEFLESMEETELDIVVMANSDLEHGDYIMNEATVSLKQDATPFYYLYAYTNVDMATNMTVAKTVDAIGGFAEDTLTYSIVMHNGGVHVANDAVLMDVVPAYVTVISNSLMIDKGSGTLALPEVTFDQETGLLRWEGDLDAGDTYTVTFQATIDADAPEGWAIINMAEFTADNAYAMYNSALTEVFSTYNVYLPIITKY